MALVSCVLRTCGILLFLMFQVHATRNSTAEPWIVSFKVEAKSCVDVRCKYLLMVNGSEFLGHYSWKLTPLEGARGSSCDIIYPDYELSEVETTQYYSRVHIVLPSFVEKIYFCLRHSVKKHSPVGGAWIHQGGDIFLEPKSDAWASENQNTKLETDIQQQYANLQDTSSNWVDLSHDTDVNYLPNRPRPTRDEENDIEVLTSEKFEPLRHLSSAENVESNVDRNIKEKNYEVEPTAEKYVPLNRVNDVNSAKVFHTNVNSPGPIRDSENDIEAFRDENYESISGINSGEVLKIVSRPQRPIRVNEKDVRVYRNENYEPISDLYNDETFSYSEMANDIRSSEILNRRKRDIVKSNNFEKGKREITNELNNNKEPKDGEKENENIISDTMKSEVVNYTTNVNTLLENDQGTKDVFSDIIQKHDNIFKRIVDAQKDNNSNRNRREIIKDINSKDVKDTNDEQNKKLIIPSAQISDLGDLGDYPIVIQEGQQVMIDGLRIEDSDKEPKIIDNGIPSVLADTKVVLRLFGQGLTPRTVIAFTHDAIPLGQPCKFLLKGEYMAKEGSVTATSALFEIIAPSPLTGSKLYICAKNLNPGVSKPEDDQEKYLHQGTEQWKMFATHNKLLPLWVSLVLILVCLMFSALFSGLNLGLMSLDRTELKIISNTGTEQERMYARAIMPVRDHGNYLLCSILLGNVAVNSTFTILLDELTSGLFAVIFSTLAIVLLGEITPQAICSRHGLMVGAKSIMITKAVMALTAPLAFPVSKLLDYFLGEEIGSVYNRERLKELVKYQVTTDVNDLDKDEVNIISGALELRKKTVSDVMTKLEDVFMLPITSVLDFETMSEIVKSGYSRIPVYEGSRTNIVTVLFIKDLAFVDPDDNTPLRTLCQYYQNPCNFVFEDVTLDVMLKQFKDGHKGHMAFAQRIDREGDGDPVYETVGLITLEDVIEEMIQAEIVDESDVISDNRTKKRLLRPMNKLHDIAAFAGHQHQRVHVSPQLILATFQFLSTSVDAFRAEMISETVLRRLLKQDVIQHIKTRPDMDKNDPKRYVFQEGKPVDYFVLILEGRVEVTVGRENLVFEAGPFTYFGVQALTQNVGLAESPAPSTLGSLQNLNMDSMLRHTFVPDYSVRAIGELYYLTIKRSMYLAAKRATLMEKGVLNKGGTNEQIEPEVDKLLREGDRLDDIIENQAQKTLPKQLLPVSASPNTNSSFKNDKGEANPEEEKLLDP